MNDFSIIIGGKAGDGINQSGMLLAHLFNYLGWYVYYYIDYPSLIRGGHNFALIRASQKKISAYSDKIDFLLALNQDTVNFHKDKLKDNKNIIYDSDTAKSDGFGISLKKFLEEEKAEPIMRNSILIGAFCKKAGIETDVIDKLFKKHIPKKTELNYKLALHGFNQAEKLFEFKKNNQKPLPVITGNEAIGLGLVNAGLTSYVAYPMTPSSSILHFLAENEENFNLKVIHPESEIGVIMMALGLSYAGEKVAVGTSGGGFCLMTEALSLSGMAEQPVVIIVVQRPGPSTGVPTYTAQADLNFVLNAGHGEFPKFVVSPGTTEQSFYWAGTALNISWKYQIPSLVLSDKALGEGAFSYEYDRVDKIIKLKTYIWDQKENYKRYSFKDSGISPLAFPQDKDAVVKMSSYEHDESGLTTEEPEKIINMHNKRMQKEKELIKELENFQCVNVAGKIDSDILLVCWGSNIGICNELAEKNGYKVVQPIVLHPFPINQFAETVKESKKIIAIENNSTGQLAILLNKYGFNVDENILKYDGRQFTLEELDKKIIEVL